jgi:hypothetical protein
MRPSLPLHPSRILSALFAIAVALSFTTPSRAAEKPPEKMKQLKTASGKVYQDVVIVSRDPHGILFRHKNGAAKISYEQLPEAIRKKDGYSKEEALKYIRSRTPQPAARSAAQQVIPRTYQVQHVDVVNLLNSPYGYPPEFFPAPVTVFRSYPLPVRNFASILPYNHMRRSQLSDAYLSNRHRIFWDPGYFGYIGAPKKIFHRQKPYHRRHHTSYSKTLIGTPALGYGKSVPSLGSGRAVPALGSGRTRVGRY